MDFRATHLDEKINLRRGWNGELAENAASPEQSPLNRAVAGYGRGRQSLYASSILVQRHKIRVDPLCPNRWLKVAKGYTAHEKHVLPPSLTITKG
jgi:hypothetical protein